MSSPWRFAPTSELIVTYNRRHFPAASLQAWEIKVQGPSTFLRGLYDIDTRRFVSKLHEQVRMRSPR